ncbi:MAG: hypothetical protein E6R02_05390 [Gammaproteobacteria bacterium]|nr:MAG: hypothetical protein E6R02_05390 [Gammaproteobacteria bacterium]
MASAAPGTGAGAHALEGVDGPATDCFGLRRAGRVRPRPPTFRGRLRERAKSYAKALANDILR